MGTDDKREQDRVKAARLMKDAIDHSAENWPLRMELFGLIAKERKAQYDAYVKAGFDPAQALRLIVAEVSKPS